jgi:hypothetical protein
LECKSSFNISDLDQFDFNKFGIEMLLVNSTMKKFNLYPIKLNNETKERIFFNYSITLNNKFIEVALFSSTSTTSLFGLNISDTKCFNKIAELLEKSSKLKTVDYNINSKSALTKILFIGEILIDQNISQLI